MEDLTRVRFTNLDKPMYPELRLIKKDVIEYYIRVAPRMLPFLRGRALVRTRYPDGVEAEGFYEKDAPPGTPGWVRTHVKYNKSADRDTSYVVCDDLDTLLWLANLASLELHMPLSMVTDTSKPDFVLFDLDPEPPAGLGEAVQAAVLLREALDDRGVKPYVKTSGRKGVHVLIHVEPVHTFRQTREYVHGIARELAAMHGFIVSERSQPQPRAAAPGWEAGRLHTQPGASWLQAGPPLAAATAPIQARHGPRSIRVSFHFACTP